MESILSRILGDSQNLKRSIKKAFYWNQMNQLKRLLQKLNILLMLLNHNKHSHKQFVFHEEETSMKMKYFNDMNRKMILWSGSC